MALTVGPQQLTVGTKTDGRAGKLGDTIGSNLNGFYYEANANGMLFSAANQAVTVTTVALATTYTGISIANPIGNAKNIELTGVGYAFVVAVAAPVAVGIMCGYSASTNVTHTTPIAPKSGIIGVASTATALVDASSTLPVAPVVERILGVIDTGAITVATQSGVSFTDLQGSIILPPGAYAAIYTSTASAASGFIGSFQWIEVPIL